MFSLLTRINYKSVALATACLGSLALTGMDANAVCLGASIPGLSSKASAGWGVVPAVYRPGELPGAELLRIHDFDRDDKSIVGLWEFKFDGFSVDWGTQAWHADGTELMFSGGQNPETGDVCQG